MGREISISFFGHVLAFTAVLVISQLTFTPSDPEIIHQVTAVSANQLTQLLKKAPSRVRPRPEIPQVNVSPDEALPTEDNRDKQAATSENDSPETQAGVEQNAGQEEGPQVPPGMAIDSDFHNMDYLMSVRNTIHANWSWPRGLMEVTKGIVHFYIMSDGSVRGIGISHPSGNAQFDRSVFRAVQASGSFPPLPSDFEEDRLGIHIVFKYAP